MSVEGQYQLQDYKEREKRQSMLSLPHIAPLIDYLNEVKAELGSKYETPVFDPCDGGVKAKALFLLEAPGSKAVGTTFISRNNPDPSAKNMNKLLHESGFERDEIILWNLVPWYVGTGKKIRAVTTSDIKQALPYLRRLLRLLPSLEVIVLVGKKVQSASLKISAMTNLPLVFSYHPSNLSLNSDPRRYSDISMRFKDAKNITVGSSSFAGMPRRRGAP